MATKVFEYNLWAAKDDDGSIWSYCSEPKKDEDGNYHESDTHDSGNIKSGAFLKDIVNRLSIKLNLIDLKEPYKFKAKLIFEGLPDNPDNPESDNINNQKQEIMPENNQTPLEQAKAAVHFHSDCKLLTKEEYEELCKYKGLYLDLKGSINNIMNQFKDK